MKICIATVYSQNYGSFLQAYALGKYFENMGHDVYYVEDYYDPPSTDLCSAEIRRSIKFVSSKLRIHMEGKEDVRVIGSDELWNVYNSHCNKRKDFWGDNINRKVNLMSYAVCAIGSSWRGMMIRAWKLNRFCGISVRDERSRKLVRPFVLKKVYKAIDPTFLIDWTPYVMEKNRTPYVLVYHYGLKDSQLKIIQEYADAHECNIISVGKTIDNPDFISFMGSPFELLGLFQNANFVFSTTFHGVALAIQFKRNFICMNRVEKVKYLLQDLHIEERMIEEEEKIKAIIDKPIKYNQVYDIIKNLKLKSEQYISNTLKRIE